MKEIPHCDRRSLRASANRAVIWAPFGAEIAPASGDFTLFEIAASAVWHCQRGWSPEYELLKNGFIIRNKKGQQEVRVACGSTRLVDFAAERCPKVVTYMRTVTPTKAERHDRHILPMNDKKSVRREFLSARFHWSTQANHYV
jgi:hypothetical protein